MQDTLELKLANVDGAGWSASSAWKWSKNYEWPGRIKKREQRTYGSEGGDKITEK